jgi:hypothetical protein
MATGLEHPQPTWSAQAGKSAHTPANLHGSRAFVFAKRSGNGKGKGGGKRC